MQDDKASAVKHTHVQTSSYAYDSKSLLNMSSPLPYIQKAHQLQQDVHYDSSLPNTYLKESEVFGPREWGQVTT